MLSETSDRSADTSEPAASPSLQRLLDVARREFVRLGFDAVSIDGVARAAGMSKETIYRYFDGKETLFQASVEALGDRYSAAASTIDAVALPADEGLARHARIICEASADGGFLSGVWLAVSSARDMPGFSRDLQSRYTARLAPLQHMIERAMRERGAAQVPGIDCAAEFGSLAVRGARHLMGEGDMDPVAMKHHAQRTARLFLFGCRTHPAVELSLLPPYPPLLAAPEVPKRPDHLTTLIAVATAHFTTRGYHRTNLDEIGEEARVGRGTLYRHFRNKAGLFDAAMLDLAQRVAAAAQWQAPSGTDPLEALRACLAAAAAVLTGRESIALHRAVIAESRRVPDLARRIHDLVREPWTRPLSEWLGEAASRGALAIDEPGWLAEQLLVIATRGNRQTISGEPLSPQQCSDVASHAIAVLIRGAIDEG